ncbi:MAG: SPOR domain-containing protein [Gammaproteobacteria bacterium]|nr:SPOR domain-containing protein [Gammaproteobacteria bacterium]
MKRKDSGQIEFDPKHRIIGAIVIVALAVIFIPMILSKREPPTDTSVLDTAAAPAEPTAEQTSEDNKVAVTMVTPPITSADEPTAPPVLGAVPTTTPSAVTTTPAPATPEPAASAPVVPPAPVATVAPPKPATKPETKPAADTKRVAQAKPIPVSAKPASGNWVVQVGTFSSATNANRVEQKLRGLGQAVHAESIGLDSGKAVRVRVGPFHDKTAALKAQQRIQKETGMTGVVLSYP